MALTLDQFIQRMADSGLITADEVTAFVDALPQQKQPADAEALAKQLVVAKRLTPFQAQQIWKGKGKSLTLGDYVISDKIGAGGMGMVFKAHHRLMKREVALKVLPPAVTKDQLAIQRFLREVEAAAKLTHPNIVAANDARENNGAYYLIMEYVEGKDLSETVKKQGPATVGQAVDFVLQAARGLEFAHEQGVIHRDIKPANLLLDKAGVVKILDMGLARIEDDSVDAATQAGLTGTGTIMGTIDYMAPEQADDSKRAGPQADIYSLGATLYFLLTAQPMVEGDTLGKKLRVLLTGEGLPDSIAALRTEVSAEVDAIFRKMTAFNMADRYETMTAVIADLEALQAGDVPSLASTPGIQPLAARSDESAMQSFVSKLDDETADAAAPTVLATAQKDAAADTMSSSVGEATRPAFKKTATFTKAVMEPNNRKLLIGGGVAACLLVGTIIWGLSGEGDEPDLKMAVADASKRTTSGTNSADPKAPTRKTKAVATIGPTTNQVALLEERELLPLVDLTSDVLHGKWKADGKGFVTEPDSGKNVLRLPAEPAGNYSVRCEYSVHGHMQLVLPVEGRSFTLKCLVRGGTDAEIVLPNVSTPVNYKDHWFAYDLSKSHVLLVNVTQDGKGLVHVAASVDGTPRFDWKGLISETEPTSMGVEIPENSLALSAFVTGVRCHLHSVRLRYAGSWTENSADAANAPPLAKAPFNEAQAKAHQKAWADHLGLPAEKTVALPGGEKMKFMLIPPGEFMMGSTQAEIDVLLPKYPREADRLLIELEGPQHSVRLTRPMYLSATEVTQRQYESIVGANPSGFAAGGTDSELVKGIDTGSHPVEKVDWMGTVEFCNRLSQHLGIEPAYDLSKRPIEWTGRSGIRLLTEAEWEFACRAGTTTQFSFGNDEAKFVEFGWFSLNAGRRTHPVAQKKANPFGLFDMHGNVMEWCFDNMGRGPEREGMAYYSQGLAIDPIGRESSSTAKAARGGYTYMAPMYHRAAKRHAAQMSIQKSSIGFRLAMTIDKAKAAGTVRNRAAAEWVLSIGGSVKTDAVPDQAINAIGELPREPFRLTEVDLKNHVQVTDADLKHLQGLTALVELDLLAAQISDAGLEIIKELTSLEHLRVSGAKRVSSAGLIHIKDLTRLESLALTDTSIDDDGLRHLSGLTRLNQLRISGTRISDSGLVHLKPLVNLYFLNLGHTKVSDGGLEHLQGLTKLQLVKLTETSVTAAGVAALQKALPDCQIDWEGIAAEAPPPAKAPFNEAQAKAHQKAWADHLGLPVEQEVELPGGAKMKFVLIPPGEFMMGSSQEERIRYLEQAKRVDDVGAIKQIPNEGPQHKVRVTRPFYLAKYEVTQSQWQAVAGSNPSYIKGGVTHPVETVSWDDTQIFLGKLNEQARNSGIRFRLPTEAQWEYACRGGTGGSWHFGENEDDLPKFGWFRGKSEGRTHPVGQLQPNPFGLHDLYGNVHEWCRDFFSAYASAEQVSVDPTGPSETRGQIRVYRGGGKLNYPVRCRSAQRHGRAVNYRDEHIGFRVAMTIDTAKLQNTQTPPADPNRTAAEWVLSVGGSVNTATAEFKAGDTLPAGSFQIESVFLANHGSKIPFDDDIVRLSGLTKLADLFIFNNTSLGDRGLAELNRLQLPNLRRINIAGTSVSDAGLSHLAGMKNLVAVWAESTPISDRGLAHLGKLRKLTHLTLDLNPISDQGLEHLESLKALRSLEIRGTDVTAAGVARLQKSLPGCKITWSGNTDVERWVAYWAFISGRTIVTDRGKFNRQSANSKLPDGPIRIFAAHDQLSADVDLRRYRGCVNLETLDLGKSSITDSGLRHLKNLKKLQSLILTDTKVTAAGVAELQKALPNCEIEWDGTK